MTIGFIMTFHRIFWSYYPILCPPPPTNLFSTNHSPFYFLVLTIFCCNLFASFACALWMCIGPVGAGSRIRCPGAGVSDSWEPLCGCWALSPVLWKSNTRINHSSSLPFIFTSFLPFPIFVCGVHWVSLELHTWALAKVCWYEQEHFTSS